MYEQQVARLVELKRGERGACLVETVSGEDEEKGRGSLLLPTRYTAQVGQRCLAMAPYQSMLPVRRDRHPPGALPRPLPLPASTSVNTRPLAPPATPGRALYDQSHFDIDVLLDSHTAGDQDALIDQAEPSWLADESAFTFGARTPARARAKAVLDDESMLQDGTLGQAGDGDSEAAHDDLLVETVDTSPVTQAPQAGASRLSTSPPGFRQGADVPPRSPRTVPDT